jgi:putative glutamine amidotransferase
MKPVIGITVESKHDPSDQRTRGKLELNWNYGQAVADAGGVPIVIPPMADMAEVVGLIDGWLIPGGLDMDACHFGEDNHAEAVLQDPSRWEAESALLRLAPKGMPIFGICYGCQFLNVAHGGSLIQHLPDLPEAETHTGGLLQDYELDRNSRLAHIALVSKIKGKSYHHQAVRDVGAGLAVVARSGDGIVEAVESPDRWLIGVQWHPERTLEDPPSAALFRRFVEAAAEFRRSRVEGIQR